MSSCVDYEELNEFIESCVRRKVENRDIEMTETDIETFTGMISGSIKPLIEGTLNDLMEENDIIEEDDDEIDGGMYPGLDVEKNLL